jgi:prolyl oligopeptidase
MLAATALPRPAQLLSRMLPVLRVLRVFGCAWLAVLAAGLGAQPADPGQPRPASDSYFGTVVEDPFRHLENLEDPAVAAWMNAQAAHTRRVLDAIPGRQALRRRIAQHDAAAGTQLANLQRRPGGLLFYERLRPGDEQPKLVLRRGGRERVLLDPEVLTRRLGRPRAIHFAVPSTSGRYVAYGLAAGGSEDASLYVLDTRDGRTVMGPISRAQYGGVAWLPDDSGFFFSRLQAMPPGMPQTERYSRVRALFVALGSSVERARGVLAFDTPGVAIDEHLDTPRVFPLWGTPWAAGYVSHGTDSELSLYIAPLADVVAGRAHWRRVVDRSDEVTDFEVVGDRLFLLSHRNAPRRRLLETSLSQPDLANARVVVPEAEGVLVDTARAADALYLHRRDGTASRLLRLPLTESAMAVEVPLPVRGSLELAGIEPRLPGVLLSLESWTQPPRVWRVSPRDRGAAVVDTGLQPPGHLETLDDYIATDVLVPSHDGAKVPLSIIHRRGLAPDGRHPTLLWGYAAYGDTEAPWFSAWRLAWLERGGVFAVANPRGSGAFGQAWYRAGFQQSKPNSWKDFIACAEYLVAQRYTSPQRLGIWGGSAGGLLVGRAMTERPDLFAAVVSSAGVLDTVRAELTANGVPNIAEFGSHQTEAGFRSLLAMSTYHQIRDGTRYPAALFTHGLNDPRVAVWHSTKTAARLARASTSGRPVLLRLDTDAGHGLGDTKAQQLAEITDTMLFLLWQFGLPAHQPRR